MSKPEITVPLGVARRFILGRQGLWPGRRWQGTDGVVEAMRAVEHLQLDPLNITARSQDLMLHARVAGYEPEGWQQPTYGERRFFDWGDWLAVRPMDELPWFRSHMQSMAASGRHADWAAAHAALLEEMRSALREAGPLSNRDFSMDDRNRVNSYRGRKDSAVALFHLWRTGEVMIHTRDRFERRYDLAERIAPGELLTTKPMDEVDRFMLLKGVAFHGLRDTTGSFPVSGPQKAADVKRLLTELTHDGLLVEVAVEGLRGPHYLLRSDLPLLETLLAGQVPDAWRPLHETTREAVTFLAPLDPVSARGRAGKLFDFDYVWEVYKPLEKRRWGYYVLPILWDDSLVARADLKLERSSGTLQVLGFWLEKPETGKDADFAAALGRGLANLQRFIGAKRLDASGIRPVALRNEARKTARLTLKG